MGKYRDECEIIKGILKAAQSYSSKSKISLKASMSNYNNLQRYLDYLQGLGLIENKGGLYKASKSGIVFLQKYEELISAVGSDGLL